MTFGDEKRRLLGWLALLAPLPLPLNDVLEWPVLFLYTFFVIYFLQRLEKNRRGETNPESGKSQQSWLSNGALNLLGLFYIPILVVDLRLSLARDQVVTALLHLVLFVILAKLYSVRREKDKWHIFVSLFLVFVASMATSSHLTIFFYLLAALGAGFYIMTRFAHLHVLARLNQVPRRVGPEGVAAPTLPGMRWSNGVALLLVVVLAVPIFASLPRLRQPFIMGQGSGNIGLSRTTGFSDSVNLSLTSEVRSNTAVALRLETDAPLPAENLRFKGTTYDFYRAKNWYRHGFETRQIINDADRLMWLPGAREDLQAGANPTSGDPLRVRIFLEPLDSRSVIVPMRTLAVDALGQVRGLRLDAGGAIVMVQQPRQTIAYDVLLGDRPRISGQLEGHPRLRLDALDVVQLSPRIAELAAEVMGVGPDEERIDRLLRHLLNGYDYTLDFTGREGEKPLEEFLFEFKSGHCELFASSMVLMLRSQGIPARFVTGFLGAEPNPLEGTYVVRQRNAHAWVEAYTEERGWQVYDPTPPSGRPGIAERDWRLMLQQLYDYVAFRWDRYVLTYGADDQRGFFASLTDRIKQWWQDLWDADEQRFVDDSPSMPDADFSGVDEMDIQSPWQRPWVRTAGLLLFVASILGLLVYLSRRRLEPAEAYDALRVGLAELGLDVDLATPPLALRRTIAERYPEAAESAGAVIDLYVASAFADREVSAEQRRTLRIQLDAAMAQAKASEKLARRTKRAA